MKKSHLLLFLIFVLIFSIFSCPNSKTYKVDFWTFDDNDNVYKKISDTPVDVPEGSTLSSLSDKLPGEKTFTKENNSYVSSGWTATVGSHTPLVKGNQGEYTDDTPIIQDLNLYEIYKTNATLKTFDFTYCVYDPSSSRYVDKEIYSIQLPPNKLFGSVSRPNVDNFNKDGRNYTFLGWSTTKPTTEIGELTNVISDNAVISSSMVLYAQYSSVKSNKVVLNIFDGSRYIAKEVDANDDVRLSDIPGYIPENKTVEIGGKTYTFIGWVEKDSSTSDILESGNSVSGETKITADKKFYAKYTSSKQVSTLTFKVFDNEAQKYTEFSDQQTVSFGTTFSYVHLPSVVRAYKKDASTGNYTNFMFKGWTTTEGFDSPLTMASVIPSNFEITSDLTVYALYEETEYVGFTALEDTDISFEVVSLGRYILPNKVSLQYMKSTEKEFKKYLWTEKDNIGTKVDAVDKEAIGDLIRLNKGESIYFVGNNPTFSTESLYVNFKSTNKVEGFGNVMYLLNNTARSNNTIPNDGCFYGLFMNCSNLVSPVDLPATSLKPYCYQDMFRGTSIVEAPLLPANSLTNGCYQGLFNGCASLLKAPALNSTSLANSCYQGMFMGCTSLDELPTLVANSLSDSCYQDMFNGCTSLTAIPENYLRATTLKPHCYQGMFMGCKGILNLPSELLKTTTLEDSCYYSMFRDCTSLEEIPEGFLPASSLKPHCYREMFMGCNKITNVPNNFLSSKNLADYCYLAMFKNCTSLENVPEDLLPARNITPYCYQEMFSGCTKLVSAPILPAVELARSCYNSMFYNCDALTVCPELPATILAPNCYQSMFNNCGKITTMPNLPAITLEGANACYYSMFESSSISQVDVLPALTLSSQCYERMFYGCTKLINVPKNMLPALEYGYKSAMRMFQGAKIQEAPTLPAKKISESSYESMFESSDLRVGPEKIEAISMTTGSMRYMFKANKNLVIGPYILIEDAPEHSMKEMFSYCHNLKYLKLSFVRYTLNGFWSMLWNTNISGLVIECPTETAYNYIKSNQFYEKSKISRSQVAEVRLVASYAED